MALAIALEHAARAQTQGRILGVIYASRASLRPPSGGAFALGGSGLSLARTGPAHWGSVAIARSLVRSQPGP